MFTRKTRPMHVRAHKDSDVFVSDSNAAQCFIFCFLPRRLTSTQAVENKRGLFLFPPIQRHLSFQFFIKYSSCCTVSNHHRQILFFLAVFTFASSSVWSAGALLPRRRPRSRAPCRGRGRGPGWRCSPACRTPPASASRSPRSSPRQKIRGEKKPGGRS